MSAAERLPRCDVGAYQGPEDNEALFYGKRGGDPDRQAGTGTLVHLARDHASKQGVEVPDHLCRPTSAEDMHGKFKPVEQPAEGASDGTVAPGNTGHVGRFEMLDAAEDDEKPDPVSLFPTLMLPNTHVTLTGPPGTFKSFFVLDIGLSAATGSREGRVWPVVNDPGAVLYATGEGGAGFKPRRRAWEKQHNGAERVTNFIRATAVPWSGNAADISAFISEARKKRRAGVSGRVARNPPAANMPISAGGHGQGFAVPVQTGYQIIFRGAAGVPVGQPGGPGRPITHIIRTVPHFFSEHEDRSRRGNPGRPERVGDFFRFTKNI